ncbi:MAG: hypothetical protein LBB86_05820, partial [Oscillospiraceae bacterium]|nr:hypothetical protein [Oscillospiraceae bacterium]
MLSENNQITPAAEGFNAAFEPILQDAPAPNDGDAVVYPRSRRARTRALREAALNALPEVADAVAGPSLPDASAVSSVMDEALDNEICKKYSLRGATLGDIYSGRLGSITIGLNLPKTIEEAQDQEECVSLPLYATGPASANPADFAVWEIEQEQNRKLESLTAKYKAEQDAAAAACFAQHPEYQKVVKGADCEEPVKFKAYNPFIKYVESREAEGAAASAAIEAQLNPYGGYLGEDGEPDISYGPYQEVSPYISPGENPHEYISQVYADATITDAEMSQIAQMLADRPQLRAVGDTIPGERDPIIGGAGFGATLCMSYVSCDAYTVTCSGRCASDPCIWYENYCGGPIVRHPADIAYMEPAGTGGGWGTRNIGDLFLAQFDQCYFWCIRRREDENPSLENPLTDAEIRELCAPERCLPAYCLDHHLAGPNMDYLETPADPRDALVGRTDEDICRVAYLLANGWGIDDNDNQWWTAWSGSVLPSSGYTPYPTPTPNPPVDSCDGRYGNWHGKPCAFARIVTQMAIWAAQTSAPRTVATGGIFIICDTHNPGNYTAATAPFRDSLDRAFANLVNAANVYVIESDCVSRLQENTGSVFTGPASAQYPYGDLDLGLSAATPYPPRSLRDLNLPVISNCNADAQSITACATDTRRLFWTAIPNEVRIVCGRVLVGPFRLHSTKGSVSAPRWSVRNTCGCNPEFPEFDETSPRCQPGEDWYHTSHCSNLFAFVDYCGNPICCDAGSFESGGRLPDEPCLDTDFYIAVKITGRYMCFTLCVEASFRRSE